MLLLPIVTLPARFSGARRHRRRRITVAVLLGSTVAVDPCGFADDPTYTLIGLAAIPASPASPTR